MTEDEEGIDFSDNPPITEERAKKGWIHLPDGTRVVPVKMDASIFRWFQSHGKDASQQMETALRQYVEAQRKEQPTQPKSA